MTVIELECRTMLSAAAYAWLTTPFQVIPYPIWREVRAFVHREQTIIPHLVEKMPGQDQTKPICQTVKLI